MRTLFLMLFSFFIFTASAQQPTAADSLALYNNSKAVADYYMAKGYQPAQEERSALPFNEPKETGVFAELKAAREAYASAYAMVRRVREERDYENVYRSNAISEYYQQVDSNKFYQREIYFMMLDFKSPMPLYDKRIEPKSFLVVRWETQYYLGGDLVKIGQYDTTMIKPYYLLTKQERWYRDSIKLSPATVETFNEPKGNPVYGTTGALIGYRTKNGFVATTRRDHLAKANKADIDLLNDQAAMKKYLAAFSY